MIKSANIIVPKTARYFLMGEIDKNCRDLWVVLHGYAQNTEQFISCFKALNKKGDTIVAPEGLSRFYKEGFYGEVVASWMTKEDRLNEIQDYINYLDMLCEEIKAKAPKAKIHLLGFSQGVATAMRWYTLGNSTIDKLVLWGGETPPETNWLLVKNKVKNNSLHVVCGEQDPFIKNSDVQSLLAFLKEKNIQYKHYSFDGGHQLNSLILKEL
tara:strand:- start:2386 stop:3021 length:636 start_codon:yes stop_codon:yes gene_type:complete